MLLDRTQLQLEQRKTQLALLNEKKAENELTLKREKKTLLESFLKVREHNHQLSQMTHHGPQQFCDGLPLSTSGSLINQIKKPSGSYDDMMDLSKKVSAEQSAFSSYQLTTPGNLDEHVVLKG